MNLESAFILVNRYSFFYKLIFIDKKINFNFFKILYSYLMEKYVIILSDKYILIINLLGYYIDLVIGNIIGNLIENNYNTGEVK